MLRYNDFIVDERLKAIHLHMAQLYYRNTVFGEDYVVREGDS